MKYSKNSQFPIGLDISDMNLKLAQLKKRRNNIEIQALGKYTLKEGIIENGIISRPEAAADAINALISKPKYGSVNTNKIVACLPETHNQRVQFL